MMDHDPPEQRTHILEQILSEVRRALDMDVAFVSRFVGDRLVFQTVEGDGESFGWHEGDVIPLDESYCKRVLDGRIGQLVPDAGGEDATTDLWVTSEAGIGSYAAVPIVLSDGRLYGTLCCVSHHPDPWIRAHDLRLLENAARQTVRSLEKGGLL